MPEVYIVLIFIIPIPTVITPTSPIASAEPLTSSASEDD